MDRKWRTNRSAIETVLAYQDFLEAIPQRDAEYTLASSTDLYAVYTMLHIERKESELRWSPQGSFYYFIAVQSLQPEGEEAQQPRAPEGDEDMPQVGGPHYLHMHALGHCAIAAAAAVGAFLQFETISSSIMWSCTTYGLQEATGPQPQGHPAPMSTAEAVQRQQSAQPGTRTQIVVPVSSACDHLTPELLQRLFSIRGVKAQQLILALVDSHGVVSRTCMYNYIQAPLEGPGTATLELLDD